MNDTVLEILLVEDNPGDADLIADFLEEIEEPLTRLVYAQTLGEAMSLLATTTIDVILLDLSLPDSFGLETLQATDAAAADIPIVIFSVDTDKSLAVEAVANGAQDYLVKGRIDSELLIRSIRYAIERKRTEIALRESEKRYRDLFDNAHDLIQSIGPDGHFLYVNQRWLDALGYAADDVSALRFEDILHPDSRPYFQKSFDQLQQGGQLSNAEVTLTTRSGKTLVVEGNISARMEAGHFIATRCIFRDITSRKQVEMERENLIAELDAFAHTVAHDLKNPMAAIKMRTDLLLNSLGQMNIATQERQLHSLLHTVGTMNSIIDALLLLSTVRQIEEVKLTPLDMADIVARVCMRLDDFAKEHQAEIIQPANWPVALGHVAWVEEIWINLLSNAIKYGGPTPRIEIGYDVEANKDIYCWVRDSGPGLTPEEQVLVFLPFERLSQVEAEGHGLGLSIVRRITEKLGGEVGVESEKRQGSTFFFTLSRPA